MLGTVVVTVATHDLAKGVLTGVLLTALSFTRRVSAMLEVTSQDAADGSRTYVVRGQVFFASAVQFANSFDRSEEHTSELQSLMRISYAVFCLKNKNINNTN